MTSQPANRDSSRAEGSSRAEPADLAARAAHRHIVVVGGGIGGLIGNPPRRQGDILASAFGLAFLEVSKDRIQVVMESRRVFIPNLADFGDNRIVPHFRCSCSGGRA
jgi:hypothetical protein